MKIALASLILTLVAYAQACCADTVSVNVFKTHSTLSDHEISTMQPTWLLGSQGSLQIMGFTQVINTRYIEEKHTHTEQIMGFGLHQQITPFMYTQVLVTDERKGQSAVKVGFDF